MKSFKRNMKLLAVAGVLSAASIGTVDTASAASGQTDVSFDFPNIIVLHYIDDLSITFSGGTDTATNEGAASDSQALGATALFDAGITPTVGSPSFPTSVAVTVNNVWAVRGITTSGNIGITGTLDSASATTGGGSSVTASSFAPSTASVPAPGLGTATAGGITFDLDVTGLTESGTHSGMQYTITATAI